jgi:uncharacterized protein (DUF302 family)
MSIKLNGTIEWVKERLVEALKAQGFGVITEIDMQMTIQQKLGVDFKPYLILGACNPRYAFRALSADESMGLLLPCNVILRQDPDGVAVSIQDPEVMFSVVDEEIKRTMVGFPQEVKTSLQSVLEALKSAS